MPLTFTPGQFVRRSEFYHQLAQLTAAGISLTAALEQLRRNPPARSYRVPLSRILDLISQGATFSDALLATGSWLPIFDIALLQAGEASGRLDACFKLLADYYTDRARVARQLITDLLYPTFLLHAAVFILPFPQFFLSGDWVAYLRSILTVLAPIYVLVALLVIAGQSRHGESWRAFVEAVLRPVPVLGTARRYLALARLSAALEALINAGVNIVEAWDLASAASGSPALRRTVLAWKPQLNAGQTPAEIVAESRVFPELFANQYMTGEVSGKLDETLRRLQRYYQDEGTSKLHAVAQWLPRVVYLVIALWIAYTVVSFYADRFRQIGEATNF